jgi:hypothetical protein
MPLIQSKQVSAGRHAGNFPGDTAGSMRVRAGLLTLGAVLGLYALWQLAAVFMHPTAPYLISAPTPDDASKAPAAAAAAQIARIRGDFWFDAALLAWSGAGGGSGAPSPALDDAHAAAVRAARLAPHDARAWLLLALLDAQIEQEPQRQIEALKMSYYTGPNDLALIPQRLTLAVRSAAIADPDFQTLVGAEVLSAVRQPALQPALLASYRQASPDGKRFLESSVGALDPGLLARMRAGGGDGDTLRH